jgi:hypothetical protein
MAFRYHRLPITALAIFFLSGCEANKSQDNAPIIEEKTPVSDARALELFSDIPKDPKTLAEKYALMYCGDRYLYVNGYPFSVSFEYQPEIIQRGIIKDGKYPIKVTFGSNCNGKLQKITATIRFEQDDFGEWKLIPTTNKDDIVKEPITFD